MIDERRKILLEKLSIGLVRCLLSFIVIAVPISVILQSISDTRVVEDENLASFVIGRWRLTGAHDGEDDRTPFELDFREGGVLVADIVSEESVYSNTIFRYSFESENGIILRGRTSAFWTIERVANGMRIRSKGWPTLLSEGRLFTRMIEIPWALFATILAASDLLVLVLPFNMRVNGVTNAILNGNPERISVPAGHYDNKQRRVLRYLRWVVPLTFVLLGLISGLAAIRMLPVDRILLPWDSIILIESSLGVAILAIRKLRSDVYSNGNLGSRLNRLSWTFLLGLSVPGVLLGLPKLILYIFTGSYLT